VRLQRISSEQRIVLLDLLSPEPEFGGIGRGQGLQERVDAAEGVVKRINY
jgi:hypothetical protein